VGMNVTSTIDQIFCIWVVSSRFGLVLERYVILEIKVGSSLAFSPS
jgi:hypothetical protein